jgi:hypothetical protein
MRLTRRGRRVRAVLIFLLAAAGFALILWAAGNIWWGGSGYCIGSAAKCLGSGL